MEAQQTPLRTAIMRLMGDMLDNPCEHGIYDTGRFMDRIEQLLCDMMAAPEVAQLSGSEAIFGFMGWLTTRNETTVLGPKQEVDVSIIERFMEVNHLSEPREMWDMLLTHPAELKPDRVGSECDYDCPDDAPEAPSNPEKRSSLDVEVVLVDASGLATSVAKGTLQEIIDLFSEDKKE